MDTDGWPRNGDRKTHTANLPNRIGNSSASANSASDNTCSDNLGSDNPASDNTVSTCDRNTA